MVLMRSTAAALAALALLAACESDPEPKFEGDSTPSAPVTSSSPTAETSVASSMSAAPSKSPEQMVADWVDAQSEAVTSGDTSAMRAMYFADCEGCINFATPIEDVYSKGGHIEGGEWSLAGSKVDKRTGRTAVVSAGVRIAAGTRYENAGASAVPFDRQSLLLHFELRREDEEWRFTLIATVS